MARNKINRIIKILTLVLVMTLIFIAAAGGKMKGNNTAWFFEGIEIQCETREQREVIKEALNDLLTLSEGELKKKEYPDHYRKGKQIKIKQVINSYFVPDDSQKVLNDDFYQELATKEVQELIANLLQRMIDGEEQDVYMSQ